MNGSRSREVDGGLAGALAAALLLGGLLGLAPYIVGRKTSTRIASEYTGVLVSKRVQVRQSKYRRSVTYSLVSRADDGRVFTVPVPLSLHHKARVGSHGEHVLQYLKPEFIEELSESCELGGE